MRGARERRENQGPLEKEMGQSEILYQEGYPYDGYCKMNRSSLGREQGGRDIPALKDIMYK